MIILDVRTLMSVLKVLMAALRPVSTPLEAIHAPVIQDIALQVTGKHAMVSPVLDPTLHSCTHER